MAKDCHLRFKNCNLCQQKGHVEAACRRKTRNQRRIQHVHNEEETQDDNNEDFLMIETIINAQNNLLYVANEQRRTDPQFFKFIINGNVELSMEADSGSYATVIHENIKNKFFSKILLSQPSLKLHSVAGVEFPVLGRIENL